MQKGLRHISYNYNGEYGVYTVGGNGEVLNDTEGFTRKQTAFENVAAVMKVDDLHLVEVQDNTGEKPIKGHVNRRGVFTPSGKRPSKPYVVQSLRKK